MGREKPLKVYMFIQILIGEDPGLPHFEKGLVHLSTLIMIPAYHFFLFKVLGLEDKDYSVSPDKPDKATQKRIWIMYIANFVISIGLAFSPHF